MVGPAPHSLILSPGLPASPTVCVCSTTLHLTRGRDSLPALMPGPAFSGPGKDWCQFCTALTHQHSPWRQTRSGMPVCPLVVTDPCCCRTIDTDVTPSRSTAHDPTVIPGAITSLTIHIRLFLSVLKSQVLPLFIASHILLFLFLFYSSTTYLLLLVTTGVLDCLGFFKNGFRSTMSHSSILAPGRSLLRHSQVTLPMPRECWFCISVYLPVRGPVAQIWWLFWASSSPGLSK